MQWFDFVGYLAAFLMFSTFYMKKMIPLRAVGMASNVAFIIFSASTGVYPLLILHICLFPLNLSRMLQMMGLIKKVREASRGDFSMDFLVPFMKKEEFKAGEVIFKKGDAASKMFYLQQGRVKIKELDKTLGIGEVIGEMGIFSSDKNRTATVYCESDAVFYTIPETQVLQLYYQNPEFGIYLVQLIVKRFAKHAEGNQILPANITPESSLHN